MATQSHRNFMTYEEFEALPREGMITMLLDGEYVVAPSPKPKHQRLIDRIYLELGNFIRTHPLGEVLLAPLDVVLSKEAARVIQPDIFFLGNEKLGRLGDAELIQGMPDLAIEVLSGDTNKYDRGKKLQYYAEYGVPELWHVHQKRPCIEIFRSTGPESLAKAQDAVPGDRLATPLLPGFELDVAALFQGLP